MLIWIQVYGEPIGLLENNNYFLIRSARPYRVTPMFPLILHRSPTYVDSSRGYIRFFCSSELRSNILNQVSEFGVQMDTGKI